MSFCEEHKMEWNLEDIVFLHAPDIFTGTFDNVIMQARHELQMQAKLNDIKNAVNMETDPLQAMNRLNQKEHFKFFENNKDEFRKAGRFEEAVLTLYSRFNGPFSSGGDVATWYSLFEQCDPAQLYNLGDPVAFTSTTVYRGSVSGLKRSLSWTPDRHMAERLAERWKDPSLGGGMVYQVDIARADVLAYLKHRREDEILLAPAFISSAEIRIFNAG
jgi:hypothetical protein